MEYPALPVVAPLLLAALFAAVGKVLPRRFVDAMAILTSAAVCGVCIVLMKESATSTIVYWFGNWKPEAHGHFPIGICFAIDPMGAGMAAFASLLVLAAFVFSWAYFDSVGALYHALMMIFLAAMCGLCLTGDLFNLFVWFELMTASAVALCGYRPEEQTPLLGALNFAVCNTVGAFLSLSGIALLYAMTGSLNMSEVGRSLSQVHPASAFVCVAFVLVICGFLVKAAAFPFHFWLADAHAVAPTPVCIIFSGVMVELGVYAIARIYWVVFASLTSRSGISDAFIVMGCAGALLGGVFCFAQRHLKRLLAFSTISHVGIMFIALGLLTPTALAGVAQYIVGHGIVKAVLFICAGILLNRFASVDEFDLRGRGRKLAPLAVLMLASAWGLAGLPPFSTYYGLQFIDHAAETNHLRWLPVIIVCAEALTAGAVVRATARIFLGAGAVHEASSREAAHIPMKPEMSPTGRPTEIHFTMWLPAVILIVGLVSTSAMRTAVLRQSERFCDGAAYQSRVLDGQTAIAPSFASAPEPHFGLKELISLAGSLVLASIALAPSAARGKNAFTNAIVFAVTLLRKIQSGRVGDYVAWLVFGVAFYSVLLLALSHGR